MAVVPVPVKYHSTASGELLIASCNFKNQSICIAIIAKIKKIFKKVTHLFGVIHLFNNIEPNQIPPPTKIIKIKIRVETDIKNFIKQKIKIILILILSLISFFAIPLQVQAQPRYFDDHGRETDKPEEAISWLTGSLTIVAQPKGIDKARFIETPMSEEHFVALVQRAAMQWESTGMGLKILVDVDTTGEPNLGNYRLEVGWASMSRIRSVNEQRAQSKKLKKQLKKRGAGILGTCVPCNLPGIAESDVFLNYEYEPGWTEELLYRVLLHEIGHLLGLAHTPSSRAYCGTSIMYPDPNLLDSTNQGLTVSDQQKVCMSFTQNDVEAIRALYPFDESVIAPIKRPSLDSSAPSIMASGIVKKLDECLTGTGNTASFKRKTKTIYHWLMLGRYSDTHLLERRWHDPYGYLVMQDVEVLKEDEQSVISSKPSVRCAALFFDVEITPRIEPVAGRWRIDVYVDRVLVRQDIFEIEGKVSIVPPLPSNKNPVPRIAPIELPDVVKELEGGVWIFRFEDGDRDIESVVIEFLNPSGGWESKAYADFMGYTVRVAGITEGRIYVSSGCWRTYAETTSKITERIKIVDRAGNESEPLQYSYNCVSERTVFHLTPILKEPIASSDNVQLVAIDIFDLQGRHQAKIASDKLKESELKQLISQTLVNGVYIMVVTTRGVDGVKRTIRKIAILR